MSDLARLPQFLLALGDLLHLLGKLDGLAELDIQCVHQVGRLLLAPVHANYLPHEVALYERISYPPVALTKQLETYSSPYSPKCLEVEVFLEVHTAPVL